MQIGSRIKISANYHWAKNSLGTVVEPPEYIVNMFDGWKDNQRFVESLKGIESFYWIKFDEPQMDADDDGLYQEAEINSTYLETL